MNEDRRYLQELIIAELGVTPSFDPDLEVERRLNFLTDQLRLSGASTYVLGISGGVDSSTAGRLCQLAVERVREDGGNARFIAMRLPYGVQQDEDDAQRALEFIRPDEQWSNRSSTPTSVSGPTSTPATSRRASG
jgi:NAD+ synthase